jgi:beta propeller repeat protein
MRRPHKEKFLIILLIFVIFSIVYPVSGSGTETLITTYNNGMNHQLPKIYGDKIVWQDSTAGSNIGIIYVYNITSGVETQVSDNYEYNRNPAIYSNNVVWTDCGSYAFCQNPFTFSQSNSIIYLYNISSGITMQVSDGSSWQDYPAIYGNRIVWQDNRNPTSQVYINGTSPGLETQVNATTSDQNYPNIYGNQIVWQDDLNLNGGNTAIYLFNLNSGKTTRISDGTSSQAFPAIYGNRIVWQDNRNSGNDEIFINGTAPGQEYSVSPLQTGPPLQSESPGISGRLVVWKETNSTPPYSNFDIFVNDTGTNAKIPIALNLQNVDLASIAYSPSPSLYRIVWDEQDSSNYNVYLYTNTSNGACPVASFTNNFAGGSAPLTGQFNDTSTYSPSNSISHWFWDFGDGSNSTLQNPSHAYSANGVYTVSLTVSNPLCRNTSTVANSVLVGQPVAGFTASPTSTAVNAPVSFTDTSQGSPTQWNWSWGDGSWTNGTTENPSHSYSAAGLYTVTLIASNAYGSGSLTKPGYITVNPGMNVVENTTINGITIQNPSGPQYLVYNYTTLPLWTFNPTSSVLDFEPPGSSGFHNISITTSDFGGFKVFPGNTTIAGTISGVHLQTNDITPAGFSAATGGPFSSINFSVNLTAYPVNAVLDTQMWQNATASDESNFIKIASGSRYSLWNQTAYTVKILKTNFPSGGSAILHMSLNASWVASKPLGRNEVFVERIDDSGTYGQVLGTHFLYYNTTSNLDYFEADSPNGLSTFGLSFLEGTGNLFQLISLTVSSFVQDSNSGGSSQSTGSGSYATFAPTVTFTPVAPRPTASPSPAYSVRTTTQGTNPANEPPGVVSAPESPAPTTLNTFLGVVSRHVYLFAAAVVAVISLLYIRQRRRRFDPLG